MEPTIQRGDHIVVDTRAFRFRQPQHQDVIVFKKDRTFFIKRVIGIPGETVEGKDGNVRVNGDSLSEPYIQHSRARLVGDWEALGAEMYTFGPSKVPQGMYYVMGDNRDVSLDSRSHAFGFVDSGTILGKALYVFNTEREGATIR
jgi:signal peptidase I